jgi:DNA-binding protein HU-alpha
MIVSTTTSKAPKTKAATKAPAKAAKAAPVKASTAPATATTPTVVDAPQAVILGPVMRKKELVEAVVARSGVKKKDVKPVVEAMLSVLGEALADNRELNLQPFGRLKVRKERQLGNGRMMITKIRQSGPAAEGETPDDDTDV